MAASRPTGNPRLTLEERLARAAARVVRWELARRVRIEVTLLSDVAMRRLNRRTTGRRAITDVLSFALPQPDGSLYGDVYVCPGAARRWLRDAAEPDRLEEELIRLAVHGTLHILGYDHPEGPGRTRSTMWRRQEGYVRRLQSGRR